MEHSHGPSAPGPPGSSGTQQILISPRYPSVPVNGSISLTATIEDSPGSTASATWQIGSHHPTTGGVGTLSVSKDGTTATYTAPPTPPISGVTDLDSQATIVITATPQRRGGSPAEAEVTITAPAISTGIAPATATAPLGTTVQFYAYAVGAVDKVVTFQVNDVPGGTEQTGTITNFGQYLPDGSYQYWGLYTAPASMPTSGDTVTITTVSQADPSKSSSAVVTLTSQ